MTTREIPPLSVLVLKAIAKKPGIYTTLSSLEKVRAIQYLPNYDLTQILVDALTEAGRLTDDVFPIQFFSSDRIQVSLKNTKLSAKYFRAVFNQCPNLEQVDLTGSFQVDDATIDYLLQKCPQVINLKIKNCRKLTINALTSIINHNRLLEVLDIGGNMNIEISGLDQFLNNYQYIASLQDLQLSGLIVSDGTISSVMRRCSSLKHIGLAYADISDQTLIRFIQIIGPKLESLNISWLSTTPMVSNNQIEAKKLFDAIKTSCPNLIEIDVSGLKSVTVNDIFNLLDFLFEKSQTELGVPHPMKYVHARFVSTSKSQLESQLNVAYPMITFAF